MSQEDPLEKEMETQPTPIVLPGKSHGQGRLAGYDPWSQKTVRHDLVTRQQQQQQIYIHWNTVQPLKGRRF